MNLLICIAISTIILTIFEKVFQRRPYILYLGTLVFGILGSLFSSPFSIYITRGVLATSLFVIVMYARVLPTKSRFYKTFMSLRAPIAIGASLLIFFHNGKTLYGYIRAYLLFGATLNPHEIYAAVCSGIMFVLLLPLTVTSFMPIRKKMKSVSWKKLQKTSYLFYFLIYAHVAFLFIYQIRNGRVNYVVDLAIYTFVFANYLFLRLALWAKSKRKQRLSRNLKKFGISSVTIVSLVLVIVGFLRVNKTATIDSETIPLADSSIVTESTTDISTVNSSISYSDGEYTGEGFGYNGNTIVKVTVKNGLISDIQYLSYEDDSEFFQQAWKSIKPSILDSQNTETVDTISGATFSSKGILTAVRNALEKAE